MKNYGYIKPVISPTDYVLGASPLPKKILQPDGQWVKYLPEWEPQSKDFDSYNCTAYNTLACFEALFERIFDEESDFSDRFTGIKAGTKPPGNDPLTIGLSMHKSGVIPETMLPFSKDLKDVEEYYSYKGSDETTCTNKGKEYETSYDLGYEIVPTNPKAFMVALQFSPLGVAVKPWWKEGEFYKSDPQDNDIHWTCLAGYKEGEYWLINDSYLADGTPFKKLAWDYPFGFALRFSVTVKEEVKKKLSLWQNILKDLKRLLELWFPPLAPVVPAPVEPKKEPPPTPEEPKYLWGTKTERIHSTRVICDEVGLSYEMKNRLCATVECESGFSLNAINTNKDGTMDLGMLGIAQYNEKWYIGPGKPIPTREDALKNPELCIRVMARAFKAGRQKDWICYRRLYGKQNVIS